MISPNEPQPELFETPAPGNLTDAEHPRLLENTAGVECFPLGDGKVIEVQFRFGKNGKKFYEFGRQKFRSKERVEEALRNLEDAITDAFTLKPLKPAKPRARNKLATVPSQLQEKRYLEDPFGKKQTSAFFIIEEWLVMARSQPNGPTWLEIAVYSQLRFPVTFTSGGFCEKFCTKPVAAVIGLDLHLLAKKLEADYKATRAAFDSLVNRCLLEEVPNEKKRGPKTVRFLWHPWIEETGLKPVSFEASHPSETGLEPISSEQQQASHPWETGLNPVSSRRINKQRNFKEHEHDHVHALSEQTEKLKAEEQDLLDQIEDLTASENRTEHFRTTWIKRIREHPIPVFSAIGETRNAEREGRITKSIGGTLNWHFENFRKAASKRHGVQEKSSAGAT